jgi:hypothetical protein
MPPRAVERPRVTLSHNFKSAEEELAYLRERVREKEEELDVKETRFESDRIAKKEIQNYGDTPAAKILHESAVMPEHDILRNVLKLEPETHDTQIDGLLRLVQERGIKNALAVAARMKNPHLEDDLHRALVRYIAEGLPDSANAAPEKVRRELDHVLFEVQPQAHGEGTQQEMQQHKLEQLLSSSEQLYAGLLSLVGENDCFSLEIAVGEGTEEASLYLGVPRAKKPLAERLISSVFPNARILEKRGDYNIFNYEGTHAGAYATLAEPPALPLKTYDLFDHDPLNLTLAAFAKIAKHGEGAALQIVLSSESDRYNKHYRKMLHEIEKGKTFQQALKTPETILGDFVHDVAKSLFTSEDAKQKQKELEMKKIQDQVATEAIGRKIKSRIAPAMIRIVASAPDLARAQELLENLEAPFGQFDYATGNKIQFRQVSGGKLLDFLRDFTFREFDTSLAMPLSLSEITSIFHFTAERVTSSRELKKSYAKQAPAPVEMSAEGIVIGVNHYGATETDVHFGTADRLRHAYVIGQTGTGKTGLIKNMIIQDMQRGDGVAFIDPHGNDIEDILAAVPPERYGDVVYFDPAIPRGQWDSTCSSTIARNRR